MNKIDKLLEELCPEGVEYKPLGEIGTFIRGKRFVRTDIVDEGVPCIHYGDIYTYYGLSANTTKTHLTPEKAKSMRFAQKNDVIIVGAGENNLDIGIGVAWIGDDKVAVHDACYIFKSKLNPMYVSYFLRSTDYHLQIKKYVSEGKICSISANNIGKAVIPIPPIEVQNEIVRILNKFASLAAELQAELQARQKQYEYYRDKLLTFAKIGGGTQGVTWMKMSEICKLQRGKVYSKDYLRNNKGDYPVFSSQTMNNGELGRIATYDFDGTYLTWTTDGAYAGTIFKRKGKFSITNVCGIISMKSDLVIMDFLYYWLSLKAKDYVYTGMGNPKLMSNQVENIIVPVPPLAEQERIAAILDRFERLTTDLQAGLPAEIKARQQQYEYYRDRLLTFKRKTA